MRAGVLAIAAIAFGTTACSRGCASSWLRERGVAGADAGARPGSWLAEQDCPGGLVRCVDGVAQASRATTLPSPCEPSPERPLACACPWDVVATCSRGCAVEGLVVEGASDEASRSCRAEPDASVSAPPPAGAGEGGCDGVTDVYRCSGGIVRLCVRDSAVPVSRCIQGCAREGEELERDGVDVAGAIAVLCRARRPTSP